MGSPLLTFGKGPKERKAPHTKKMGFSVKTIINIIQPDKFHAARKIRTCSKLVKLTGKRPLCSISIYFKTSVSKLFLSIKKSLI